MDPAGAIGHADIGAVESAPFRALIWPVSGSLGIPCSAMIAVTTEPLLDFHRDLQVLYLLCCLFPTQKSLGCFSEVGGVHASAKGRDTTVCLQGTGEHGISPGTGELLPYICALCLWSGPIGF
jgi:hypothetical protein